MNSSRQLCCPCWCVSAKQGEEDEPGIFHDTVDDFGVFDDADASAEVAEAAAEVDEAVAEDVGAGAEAEEAKVELKKAVAKKLKVLKDRICLLYRER